MVLFFFHALIADLDTPQRFAVLCDDVSIPAHLQYHSYALQKFKSSMRVLLPQSISNIIPELAQFQPDQVRHIETGQQKNYPERK